MVLEKMFAASWTLRKLRHGPLGGLLEGFCDWLLSREFSRARIRMHLANVSHLNTYLARRTVVPLKTITAKDVEGFLARYPMRCHNRGPLAAHLRRVRHSIGRFTDFLRQQGHFDPLVETPVYQPILNAYLSWMRDCQHAADGTLALRAHSISRFLAWLGSQASAENLPALTAEQVEAFFLAQVRDKGCAARRAMQAALRTFLRFCLHHGYIRQPLDHAVPTLRTYKLSAVPRGLSEAQAQKVLQSVDRRTNVGRRDYAILQLLHTYGVRGGQVRALRLTDIRWAEDRILFRATKQGKDSLLPLTVTVGESLLDYLRNARSRSAFAEVFLTCRAPSHPLWNAGSLSEIVRRHLRAVGIDVRSKGAHAFRHGFATRMVAAGHSLKAVADVLGHRHLSTTFIYTKVDFHALREVALDWPEEVCV